MERKPSAFVMSVRKSLRLYSVRVHAVMSAAITYLLMVPDAALPLLNALPPEMRREFPFVVGAALVAVGIVARIKAQPKVTGNGQ